MNPFYEFHKMVRQFRKEGIDYALVGGVAMAIHAEPRFTKDIDLLVRKTDLERVSAVLGREGYSESAKPWTFRKTRLTLHRFLKTEGTDQMLVDVLVAGEVRHERIIRDALVAEAKGTGLVRVAAPKDLIWLKRKRDSKQDRADIERLKAAKK